MTTSRATPRSLAPRSCESRRGTTSSRPGKSSIAAAALLATAAAGAAPVEAAPVTRIRPLRVGRVLLGAGDREVAAHEDHELLAGAGGDVRLVGSRRVDVGLAAHDGRA